MASRTELNELDTDRREAARPSVARARSWTGRSAVACATDSHLSTLFTAGTRVTRVSAMRILPVRAGRLTPKGATIATDLAHSQRGRLREPPIASG